MRWHSSYDTYHDGVADYNMAHHYQVRERPEDSPAIHELYVSHAPDTGAFTVRVGHADATGLRHMAVLKKSRFGDSPTRLAIGGGRHDVGEPSEDLKTLIAHHHENPDQEHVLLDRLAEEYPDMQQHIDRHTAARYA